ncbi:MAG: hypothetical protein CMH54_13610, partial [Myxococcales bacterium]|nr:hypothetical protein [Myxococcales bacterium]
RPGSNLGFQWMLTLVQTEQERSDPLVRYLLAFQLEKRGLWSDAAQLFCALDGTSNLPRILQREAYYRCGRLLAYEDKFEPAALALERAIEKETLAGERTPIMRWLRYIQYRRTYRR